MRAAFDTVEEFWSWEQVEQSRALAGDSSCNAFEKDLSRFIGVDADCVRLMPSGHQGLEWLLRARLDSRRCVMVPAFNCSVVQDAVTAAGLHSQLYDFSPKPGVFDWERIIDAITPNVGVLMVTHYFGVPIDFRPVLEHCAAKDIVVIEDCAHTLGGTVCGRQVGTIADAAIFSFNYDKPISLGWGGAAVINNKSAFDANRSNGYTVPRVEEEMDLLRSFVSVMSERRRVIRYQNLLPIRLLRRMKFLRPSVFNKSSHISIGAVQAELGRWCLAHYSQVSRIRKRNAERLAAHIPLQTWPVDKAVEPVWIKQKVHIPSRTQRLALTIQLQREGIRAGNFNWPNLIDGRGRDSCAQALNVAENWIDIPVHQNLTDFTIGRLINSFTAIG